MSRVAQISSIVLSLVLLTACNSTVNIKPIPNAENVVIEVPEYKSGDRWNYTNGYFEEVLGYENELLVTTSTITSWCQNCRYYRDRNYATVRVLDANGRSTGGYVGMKLLDFPLKVGKKWDQTTTLREVSTGLLRTASNSFSIVAFEEVTVTAGIFRAFKIRLFQHYLDTPWSGSCDMWWSPDVKNFIKRSVYTIKWFDDFELVSYSTK